MNEKHKPKLVEDFSNIYPEDIYQEKVPFPEERKKGVFSWSEKLEFITSGEDITEIVDADTSVVIKRINKQKNPSISRDWDIELRNPQKFNVRSENFHLKNGVGLIRTIVNARFPILPNLLGLDYSIKTDKLVNPGSYSLTISDTDLAADDIEEYHELAEEVIDFVDRESIKGKVVKRESYRTASF